MFDVEKMFDFCCKEIMLFANDHKDEIFYGFSIDAGYLCLNSEERFEECLKYYKSNFKGYDNEDEIQSLKRNTGDWEYQGFAEMFFENGFDEHAYADHYEMSKEKQKESEYAQAVDALVEKLSKSDVFKFLNTTKDFYVNRVEHDY